MNGRRVFVLLIILGWLAGCIAPPTALQLSRSDAQNQRTPTPASATLETPTVLIPEALPPGINPLTGQLVDDPAVLNRLPLIVKISNAPPVVRPQAGLGEADLVYEHYVEGGLTRFSAIFYSQAPERIGSLRSARLIDLELVPMYSALLAYSGANVEVERRLNESDFANRLFKGVLFGLPYFWRDQTIEAPHNLFLNARALWRLAADQGLAQRPELRGLAFMTQPPAGMVGPGVDIDIRYRSTRVRWKYDPESGLYRRFADGLGHFDGLTFQQITAANVVILLVDHQELAYAEPEGNTSFSTEIRLWAEGDAILLRDGQRYDGRWVRPTRQDRLGLRTADGRLLYLKPGITWFQVFRLPEQQLPDVEWITVS